MKGKGQSNSTSIDMLTASLKSVRDLEELAFQQDGQGSKIVSVNIPKFSLSDGHTAKEFCISMANAIREVKVKYAVKELDYAKELLGEVKI